MKGFLKLLVWVAIVGGVLFLIGWAFLFVSYTSDDNAMAPNIIRGDNYLVYTRASLTVGTPVVCEHPTEAGTKVVGRIVGGPGDRVSVQRGSLFINGNQAEHTVEGEYVLVDERNTGSPQTVQLTERIETIGMIRFRVVWPREGSSRSSRRSMREREVPEGTFFLFADNRAFGEDSRVYGPVQISGCIGRPLLIYHPAEGSGDAGSGARWFDIIR